MADPSVSTTGPPSSTPAAAPNPTTSPPPPIHLRAPLKYGSGNASTSSSSSSSTTPTFTPPPLAWLERTWTVTHSTLPMWRSAKNVRITYKILPSEASSPAEHDGARLDDIVTSAPLARTLLPQPRSIHGIDAPSGPGAWKWRGVGWLKIASSRWEVLGWGEDEAGECWVVTWFEKSLFTPAGVDVYCSRREGISAGLYARIEGALKGIREGGLGEMCGKEMRGVVVDDA